MTKPGAQNFYSKQNLLENNMTSQIPARKAGYKRKQKCQKMFRAAFQIIYGFRHIAQPWEGDRVVTKPKSL